MTTGLMQKRNHDHLEKSMHTQSSQIQIKVQSFPDKAVLSLKSTYHVFAQEESCHVRADKFLSETFIKQN